MSISLETVRQVCGSYIRESYISLSKVGYPGPQYSDKSPVLAKQETEHEFQTVLGHSTLIAKKCFVTVHNINLGRSTSMWKITTKVK